MHNLRRLRQCRECDSPAEFTATLDLSCPRPGFPDFKLYTHSNVRVCSKHMPGAAALLLCDRTKIGLIEVLAKQGIPPPDMDRLAVDFVPFVQPMVM